MHIVRLVACAVVMAVSLTGWALPQPGLMQYRLTGFASGVFMTSENWENYRNDKAVAPVVTPGALMAKKANVNGTTWKGVEYPFTNVSGYWYEGYMKLEAGKSYSGYSRFDDGGCIYLDGVELYNQGTSSGYNSDTSRERHVYTPSVTGWYKVQLGLWDWGSNRSCQNYTIAGVQWSDEEPPVKTGSGSGSLWYEFWDADSADATEALGNLLYTEDPSLVRIVEGPSIAFKDGTFEISVTTCGTLSGGKVYAVFGPTRPFAYTNFLGDVSIGTHTLTGSLANAPAGTICGYGVYTVSDDETHRIVEKIMDDTFSCAVVTVARDRDTTQGLIGAPGRFVVTRPAELAEGDLTVYYSVGGDAVPGRHYEPLPGSVVIPDGEESAMIEVLPHLGGTGEHTVSVVLQPRNYMIDPATSSASLSIAYLEIGKRVSFKPTGYTGTETLTNFPVLVRLSEANIAGFSYSDFKCENGGDLRFAIKSGQMLPYEIQKWDEEGESLVWVRVPELTADTEIRAYYGSDSADVAVPTRVWSDNFLGVWHLDTVTDGATPDATGHGLAATNRYPTKAVLDSSVGAIGGSINNSMAQGSLTPSFTNQFCGSRFTVSGWFKRGSGGFGNSRFLSTKRSWNAEVGFEFDTSSSGSTALTITTHGGSSRIYPPCKPQEGNDWKKYTLVFDNKLFTFYTNGVPTMVEQSFTPPVHGETGFSIGNNAALTETSFPGNIDEVRFATFVESADWAKAEYDTETSPTFLSNTGARMAHPGVTVIYR